MGRAFSNINNSHKIRGAGKGLWSFPVQGADYLMCVSQIPHCWRWGRSVLCCLGVIWRSSRLLSSFSASLYESNWILNFLLIGRCTSWSFQKVNPVAKCRGFFQWKGPYSAIQIMQRFCTHFLHQSVRLREIQENLRLIQGYRESLVGLHEYACTSVATLV